MSLNPDAMVFVPGKGMVKVSEAGGGDSVPSMPKMSDASTKAAPAAPAVAEEPKQAEPVKEEKKPEAVVEEKKVEEAPAAPAVEPKVDDEPTKKEEVKKEEKPAPAKKSNDDDDNDDDDDDDDDDEDIPDDEELKDDPREHLNIVFIGHVDAGKSTISGQVLLQTGQVDERTIEKYTREAEEKKHASWFLAYIMDTNEEERAKGKTVEVGRAHFDTEHKRYTVLDAPGHKNYVPNMIAGAAQADVGVLVISARKGEFETGFEKDGQTKEHAMLIKTLGVSKVVVLVNKMDESTVQWKQARFDNIVTKLTPFLKSLGYNAGKDVWFIPASGLTGANICKETNDAPWFTESPKSLLGRLDALPAFPRKTDAPVRVPILSAFKDRGTTAVLGKVEQGTLERDTSLMIMPGSIPVEVTAVYCDEVPWRAAVPGENVKALLKGITEDQIAQGAVLTDAESVVPCVYKFVAQVQILELLESKPILTRGYSCMIHIHTAVEEVTVTRLLAELDRKGKPSRKNPPFLKSKSIGRVIFKASQSICLEKFVDCNQLGRFTLRDEGRTIAMGKIVAIEKPSEV
mmetsp:Transcript_16012/g.27393  ORF Transcript_16012/g.27393 Transcript_16012/m.27393 type:complete len:572 (-) Transcript_16012:500-2215(-)|eukprot:CAMPEP_0168589292 /NCGR_PEP_ID=MMETSP0420-20121227/5934_1 /TAXON_ID=498008 /ORGANISM="Pessonella sp." /LENGTH=571 /DNA_ID=CAMNT_0008624829 /DNA_START=59 /DNA_END=1774 /DNA_ORIENTATION=+